MNKFKRLTSRGDTIVEVMIVLTVLAMALSISYATASRSLTNARQAQENTEATTVAQSQVEQLRNNFKSTDPNKNIYIDATPFCINDAGNVVPVTPPKEDFNNYTAECVNGLYHKSIKYDGANTFTVTVLWEDLSGNGQSSVNISYRLHKP